MAAGQNVAVIDYGMGNLHSVASALRKIDPDAQVVITSDADAILAADRVIFPGVGAIRDCMAEILRLNIDRVVRDVAASGKPLLAICVGMQALMEHSEENDGVGFVPVSQRRGRRFSVLDGYYAPARRRPNLTVVTEALATRVVVEDGRAVGVEYVTDDDERDQVRCEREVVLCAGAIGTPHLLQLSGVGPREPLEAAG